MIFHASVRIPTSPQSASGASERQVASTRGRGTRGRIASSCNGQKKTPDSSQTSDFELLLGKYGASVQRQASRLSRRGRGSLEQADLAQEGMIGLMEAWQAFQSSRSVPFYAYAHIRVRGAMIDRLRRERRAPRKLWARLRELERKRAGLESLLCRKASMVELSQHLKWPVHELQECERERHIREPGDSEVLPELVDTAVDLVAAVERAQLLSSLRAALGHLTERQLKVIGLYYSKGMNQLQIAKLLGISEGRVSQIRVAALRLLRKAFQIQDNPQDLRNGEVGANC